MLNQLQSVGISPGSSDAAASSAAPPGNKDQIHILNECYLHLCELSITCYLVLISGETSTNKLEEVKRLPGGKIKKKVRV